MSKTLSLISSRHFFLIVKQSVQHIRSYNTRMVKIGTHNGSFHADEALACSMLKILPQYKDAEIVRSRDPSTLDKCDIVVDVGGVYDPARHRYDHHQKTFGESFSSIDKSKKWVTKLSSAGLVYVHFGKEIIATLLNVPVDEPSVDKILDKVYEGFIEEIDAIDNGISTHDGEPRYTISTNLSSRVGHLSPAWNEPNQDFDAGFMLAMDLVKSEFMDRVNYYAKQWWPARALVVKAMENRFKVDPSGQILDFSEGGCPWKQHLFELEEEQDLSKEKISNGNNGKILYSIFTDQNGMWRILCVSVRPGSFENRLSLPASWRGLRDDALVSVSGVEGAKFVHANGFTGGCSTREGVLKMANLAMQGVQ